VTLPIVTRYVRVEQDTSANGDGYDPPTWTVLAESVPAHIGSPTGSANGDRLVAVDATLYVEDTVPVPLNARVTDLATGDVYAIQWTQVVVGLGLDHRKCGINRISGSSGGA